MSTDTPSLSHDFRLVAVFEGASTLARALEDVLAAGVPASALSVLARDGASGADTPDTLAEALDPPAVDEVLGGLLGGYVGLLSGLALMLLPGIGPVVVAGGAAAIAAETLAATAGGLGLGTLFGAIFDEDHVERHRELYRQALADGHLILAVHGTEAQYLDALRALERHAPLHLNRAVPASDAV